MKRILVLVFLFLLAGCGPKLDGNAELARQYLEDKGYSIKSYEGKQSFTFKKHDLLNKPYDMVWAVQPVKPDPYIGKEITQEVFIVKNHPLGKIYGPQTGFSSKVEVSVFIYNDEIIGGTSFPIGKGIAGSPHSLDGLTVEEFLEDEDYRDWRAKWDENYRDQ
jgi:hypothetical protein